MNQNISSFQDVVKQIDRMSLDEQLDLIAYIAGKIKAHKLTPEKSVSLRSIIGTGKGCFATPEEADNFISEQRYQWQL
ncbi:hypothetical protein ACOKW7_19355 [Limnospira platensis CENA597]|uniref:hypothetical protein n=1 Tax=Limnospira platensis TaxID=118562 RepID=UPI0012C303DF|nr:hypothetical protein [Arthrospira sp. PLM2.Bin9]TVU54232.1 MAG: hypothetical protein EA414_07960 [Arthrospira sp. PLM2.Bin9]